MEKHAGCFQQSRKAVHMRDFFMQGNPIVSKRPPQTISFWTLFFLLTFSQCETPIYSKQVTQQSNLVCWGVNDDGQLDIPIFKEEVVEVVVAVAVKPATVTLLVVVLLVVVVVPVTYLLQVGQDLQVQT